MYESEIMMVSSLLIFTRFSINSSLTNGVYTLRNNDSLEEYQVYCHMTEIAGCGSGGWTLLMKMEGNKVKIPLY